MESSAISQKPIYCVSVRSLVEHVLRSGDLRSDVWGAVQALDGIRIHQLIQRQRPEGYESEVSVRWQVDRSDFSLSIGGRIDGVWRGAERVTIEEIKTTALSFDALEAAPNPIHWGQAQCYAYMLASQEGLTQVDVQLTYAHPDARLTRSVTRSITRSLSLEELAAFFNNVLDRYLEWMAIQAAWAVTRNQSLKQLAFPYDGYRPGQRLMAVEVYRTIRDNGQLVVQAATGIGKTMAALFPALKALGEQLVPKLIFLTARTTGRLAAETALTRLRQNGLRLKAATLTAKDKICFNPASGCLPEECEYAAGHYNRLNQALAAAFEYDAWTRDTIEGVARQYQVCPFEFSLELVLWADCVIGDYNYAFDPKVLLRRLFGEEGGRHAVLVDEAHNLVDRSREMFSAHLTKMAVQSLQRSLKQELPRLARSLGRIHAWLASERRRCVDAQSPCIDRQPPQALVERLTLFTTAAEKWLRLNLRTPFRAELLALFFDCLRFIRVAEQYTAAYATITQAQGPDLQIKLFCIDPADQLREAWKRFRAAVLFSATLTPSTYFQSILGCSAQTRALDLPSPFAPDHLAVYLASSISTLYRQRQESSREVCGAITALISGHTGHYILFFPSYDYLSLILDQFAVECPAVEIVVQSPGMSEAQRTRFLERFDAPVSATLVGFAVMGGIFGEGIDLKGERLTGAAIVGVGLPGIGPERELIRAYFDQDQGCGFAYAYQYPGINRVLQAAGRVIRSESDRGVLMLIDQRYATPRYRALLPLHWQIKEMGTADHFRRQLIGFWSKEGRSRDPIEAIRFSAGDQ